MYVCLLSAKLSCAEWPVTQARKFACSQIWNNNSNHMIGTWLPPHIRRASLPDTVMCMRAAKVNNLESAVCAHARNCALSNQASRSATSSLRWTSRSAKSSVAERKGPASADSFYNDNRNANPSAANNIRTLWCGLRDASCAHVGSNFCLVRAIFNPKR